MMIRAALALFFVAAPLAAQANGTAPTRSATQGVYSDSQAVAGEAVYQKVCASCHELSFHTGEEFRMNWFSRNVWDLFKILKTTMPEDNIGGLSDDEYTRVIAYVFKLNGFPASADSLRADSTAMRAIRIGPLATDSTKPPTRRR